MKGIQFLIDDEGERKAVMIAVPETSGLSCSRHARPQ